ncbi:MAG: hypothetical protein Q9218_003970 [Villophora microphyllina]
MSSPDSNMEELERMLDEMEAESEAREHEDAQAAGFATVGEYHAWIDRIEKQRSREYIASIEEKERNGNLPAYVQKERDDTLRDSQMWRFNPDKCDCEEHIDGMFCPGNLQSIPNSTTGILGKIDEVHRGQVKDMNFDVRSPSKRFEGSDVSRLWSINSQEEQNGDEIPFWARGDRLAQYLAGRPGASSLDAHYAAPSGSRHQDIEMMEATYDSLVAMEPSSGLPHNSIKKMKGGKGEIKAGKNRSAPARLPARHSQRSPPMKKGSPKRKVGSAIVQRERSCLGEPAQTRSQTRKTFAALNIRSQPEVIEVQPRRSARNIRSW